MDAEHLLAFNLALLAAIASPGPALLYALRMTLGGGRAAGIATGCGLAVMAATWTLMALLGLDGLFRLFPWAYTAFKIAGALYLLYVAWTTWRGARDQAAPTVISSPSWAGSTPSGKVRRNVSKSRSTCRLVRTARRGLRRRK